MSGADFHIRVSNILDHVNDFNIPLCQLKLRAVFAATNQSALDAANILFKIVLEKARVPGNAVADLWGAVIWGLPLEHALHVSPGRDQLYTCQAQYILRFANEPRKQ